MSRVYADFPWRVFITTRISQVITDLDSRGTDRQFLYVLNGPAYHTGQAAADDFEINRPYPNSDDPALLTNNRRLLYAVRRELGATPNPYVCRFGGIVMTLEDQGADAPTTRYTAYDPWQYMLSRPARYPLTGDLLGENGYTYPKGQRASDIALDMLTTSEAQDGETHIDYSDLGLVEDTAQLDAPFVIEQSQSVGEVWQALCDTGTIDILLDPIYDPIDRPGKVCELRIQPFAGEVRNNCVMGWDTGSHSVVELTRTIDRMANKVRFLSGAAATAVTASDATSIAANGIYWAQQSIGGSTHQAEADVLALAAMYMRRNGERAITLTPISDRLDYTPLRDYALGDYLPIWASRNLREPLGLDYGAAPSGGPSTLGVSISGAAVVGSELTASISGGESPEGAREASGYQRVYGIPITVDDNGVERVEGLITSQDSVVG